MKALKVFRSLKERTIVLYDELLRDGGFSYDYNFEEPTKGYMVSIKPVGVFSINGNDHMLKEVLEDMLEVAFKEVKGAKNLYVGGWLDQKTNLVYIDISEMVEDLSEALGTAELFNQLAIYDVIKQDVIDVKKG